MFFEFECHVDRLGLGPIVCDHFDWEYEPAEGGNHFAVDLGNCARATRGYLRYSDTRKSKIPYTKFVRDLLARVESFERMRPIFPIRVLNSGGLDE